jgi:SAM-dependent methyltransferase
MSAPLIIPDAAIPYLLFQRTAYLRFPVVPLYRVLHKLGVSQVPLPIYNRLVAIEARFGRTRIKTCYQADMQQEYQSIRAWLPEQCAVVLDIGCGVAGIDLYLHHHYADHAVQFFLLDKSVIDANVYYLFQSRASFYNSLAVAKTFLVRNGIAPEQVQLLEANDRNEIAMDVPVDVTLSLLSWGFHYPVSTYLDRVYALLRDDGVVILDVRKGTDGMAVLTRTFAHVDVICETRQQYRVAARK